LGMTTNASNRMWAKCCANRRQWESVLIFV
jgi:hypothetical protein